MMGALLHPDAGAMRELDTLLLDAEGLCRPVPHAELARFRWQDIAAWANVRQLYQVPTVELIDWLNMEILGKAIEICAGRGCVGLALGIPQTDAYLDVPELQDRFAVVGREMLPPRPGVIKAEALAAVKRFRPTTVVACWATQLAHRGQGSSWGVDESRLIKKVRRYIVVGNIQTHGRKRIMQRPHREHAFPWLVSRSVYPNDNRIWVWG